MKTTNLMKRALALLLAVTMIVGMVGCGKRAKTDADGSDKAPLTDVSGKDAETTDPLPTDYDRDELELIVDLLGEGQSTDELSDKELDRLVEDLVSDLEERPDNIGSIETGKNPAVDMTDKEDAYDENGAMNQPFDQVYPELIEKEEVAFSGESILIKLASGKLTDGLKAAGVGALDEIVPMDGCAWYEAHLIAGTEPGDALAAVRQLKEVLLAEYNYEVQVAALDDYKHFDKDKDEEFQKNGHNKDQWHFHHCGIVDGYAEMETAGGDPSVVVAVIDSGVDYDHEDLKDNMWINTGEIPDNGADDDGNGYIDDYYGADVVSGTGSGDDTNGHGTHVAGIIAARNNNTGVLGIAYNVKIMSVKAAMHNGTLNQADIARAVKYAYENGAEVINMSFGGTACSIAVQDALAAAYTRCVLVASAGNSGMPNEMTDYYPALPNYPAALSYVLGVMSVDEAGRESVFTNWDAKAFNGVEYELYAPGENIMSTLPDDQYGYLSGTSMAAPVVSAFAAILRSEFADRDMYPTKFIYGQLAATSGIQADCLDPEKHTVGGNAHSLPQVADLHAALTKLPNPEVNMQDYAIFDDPAFSDANNGDGVIDAGETIALGLTLRNRWGMSKNTVVTIDTVSESSGKADPYITIENPTVDYGSVGTYSTQDCGKIYTDGVFTGWEEPFFLTVAEDCPNDYRFTVNVTVTCENALNEEDTAVYSTGGTVDEAVRNGVVLPSVIEEDMTLTPDNLYIIPKATVIHSGATVRVEPGTRIQFWSDDPNDPYAEEGIAFLQVEGELLVEGTKENPVYIYPSELMDNFIVDIGEAGNGHISLRYAHITNLNKRLATGPISEAYGCTFTQNYGGYMQSRHMSSGVVDTSGVSGVQLGRIDRAEKCVFYKLGFNDESWSAKNIGTYLSGTMDTCIFAECGMRMEDSNLVIRNCVFLGNAFINQSKGNYNQSTLAMNLAWQWDESNYRVYYRPETGTTYVVGEPYTGYEGKSGEEYMRGYLAALFGGDYAVIETEEESNWLGEKLVLGDCFRTGIRREADRFVWSDGAEVGAFLMPKNDDDLTGDYEPIICSTGRDGLRLSTTGGTSYVLYEIPGHILPENITFRTYTAELDLETTLQLQPVSAPTQLALNEFLYESSDESVLTVSDTGLVTPVSKGTADVWVWSLDRAVKNRVTITVKDYVALENFSLTTGSVELAAGDKLTLEPVFAPENTTRRGVTYSVDNAEILTVEKDTGIITAVAPGRATVTAACEGLTATVEVLAYGKTTELGMDKAVISAALSDGTVALPNPVTNDGAEPVLTWSTLDEEVATVVDGALQLHQLGTTTLVMQDERSGLQATCLVLVQEVAQAAVVDVQENGSHHIVLLEDGSVYYWDSNSLSTPELLTTGAIHVSLVDTRLLLCKADGTLEYWELVDGRGVLWQDETFAGKEVVDIELWRRTDYFYFVTLADGSTYAKGYAGSSGALGLGTTEAVEDWQLVMLENVTEVLCQGNATYFLTAGGDLYFAGGATQSADPVLMAQDISRINRGSNNLSVRHPDGSLAYYDDQKLYDNKDRLIAWADMDEAIMMHNGETGMCGIRDGRVYIGQWNTFPTEPIPGITNAAGIYPTYDYDHWNCSLYIISEDGMLYLLGKNSNNSAGGITQSGYLAQPLAIPMLPLVKEEVRLSGSNLTGDVLTGEMLQLSFNKELTSAAGQLYADGMQVVASVTLDGLNRVSVCRSSGFAEGVSYEAVFPAGSLHALGGSTNGEEVRISFLYEPAEVVEEEDAPVVYESILAPEIQRILTRQTVHKKVEEYRELTQMNPLFINNAILNPTYTDTDVSHWLRPVAAQHNEYFEVALGGNWWGTTNETLIGLQMVDYTDMPTYTRLMYAPYLTEAPENTFPFVTDITLLNKYGEEVTTVGNETVTFRVEFNRDMDTSIPLQVRFGSAYPYGDYEVAGEYVDARTWEGTYTLNTLIENGYQYFAVSNGCSATDELDLLTDMHRFSFEIDTTAAQALIMQGTATETGIELKWTQDDFQTLMGYHIYRSTAEDGYYTRLNKTVIPADTMTWFDDTVEPGVVYYYNFTVVQTDLSESEPSGKIVIMSKDTMAPNIYHSPVANAFTGANLVLSATITDNLNIAYANLYYRVSGSESWHTVRMNKLNDKYSAIIPAAYVTVEGVEYYIEAFDGVSYTYKGSAEKPFTVAVQEAVSANALGDVDGDGVITNLDALLVLYTINDKYNMTAEEFARADLNGDGVLWAAEALRILQYVSGAVGSVKM